MALVVIMISGLIGMTMSLVALFGYGVSIPHALVIYFVFSIVPVALVMAGIYLHMQITRVMTAHKGASKTRPAQR